MGGVNVFYSLSSLASLVAAVVMVFAAVMAVRHVGGRGPMVMLIGTIGGVLPQLFWVFNMITQMVGVSPLDRIDPMKVGHIYRAVGMFGSVFWLLTGIGVLLLVFQVGAMIKRSEVLGEIRGEFGA